MNNQILRLTFCALVVAALFGCGASVKKVSQEASNLKPLAVLYGQYTGQHRGQPPANAEEFKAFVKSIDPAFLKSFEVNDPESLFISSRDNKPYVVLYGAAGGPPGPGGQPVIAYEQEGVAGKRYVASFLGAVEEVDEQKFRELVPTAK